MIGHTAVADAPIAGRRGGEPRAGCRDGLRGAVGAATVLEVREVSLEIDGVRRLDDVSISVAAGEIVGVAGVSGNGQTELVEVLCATTAPTSGSIHVDGVDVTADDPVERIRAGLGRITEDRRGSVVPGLSVEQNLVLEDLDRFRRLGFTKRRRVRQHARRLIADFDIRAEPQDAAAGLSGGNLQKVLLARALSRGPKPSSSPSRLGASTSAPTPTSTTSCASSARRWRRCAADLRGPRRAAGPSPTASSCCTPGGSSASCPAATPRHEHSGC